MIETKSSSLWSETSSQQGLCLGMLAVHAMENPQVIQGGDDTGMKFAVHGLV